MNASNPPELRECPFCGSMGVEVWNGRSAYIQCTDCQADSGWSYGLDKDAAIKEAAANWNRRSAPASAEGLAASPPPPSADGVEG